MTDTERDLRRTIAQMTIASAQDKAHIASLTAQLAGMVAREAKAELARLDVPKADEPGLKAVG
jgi:hypothetical protein